MIIASAASACGVAQVERHDDEARRAAAATRARSTPRADLRARTRTTSRADAQRSAAAATPRAAHARPRAAAAARVSSGTASASTRAQQQTGRGSSDSVQQQPQREQRRPTAAARAARRFMARASRCAGVGPGTRLRRHHRVDVALRAVQRLGGGAACSAARGSPRTTSSSAGGQQQRAIGSAFDRRAGAAPAGPAAPRSGGCRRATARWSRAGPRRSAARTSVQPRPPAAPRCRAGGSSSADSIANLPTKPDSGGSPAITSAQAMKARPRKASAAGNRAADQRLLRRRRG